MPSRRRFGRIRALKSGRFQARAPLPGGRSLPAPHTFRTKTDAARWLSQIETEQQQGKWIDHRLGKGTTADWAQRWLDSATHLKPKTLLGYESLTRTCIVPALGTVPIGQLRTIAVKEWVSSMTARGLSPSRVRQAYGLLSQMMDEAERSGYVAANPCRGVRLPRLRQRTPNTLTPSQVEAIAAAAKPPYGLFVNLLAYGGLRIGEAFALKRSSVDQIGRRLIVSQAVADVNGHRIIGTTKTHQQRKVSLPPSLFDALVERLEDLPDDPHALIFPDSIGGPLDYTNFMRHVWRPAVNAAVLVGFTPHNLRQTCATWIVDSGYSMMDAAAHLGHSSSSVTSRHYATAVKGREVEIADRLEDGLRAAKSSMIHSVRARSGHEGEAPHLRAVPE